MFKPTHVLISRSRQVPVQLMQSSQGVFLMTEQESDTEQEPAFMLHPKRGFFCRGVQVLGYSLQPINSEFAFEPTQPVDQASVR